MTTHLKNDEHSEGVKADEQSREVAEASPAAPPTTPQPGPVASMARALAAAYASRRRVLRRGVLHTV
jgi:hypothetical protein